jgi:hypothetical protein
MMASDADAAFVIAVDYHLTTSIVSLTLSSRAARPSSIILSAALLALLTMCRAIFHSFTTLHPHPSSFLTLLWLVVVFITPSYLILLLSPAENYHCHHPFVECPSSFGMATTTTMSQ